MPKIENNPGGDHVSNDGDRPTGEESNVVLRATDLAKTYDSPLPFTRSVEVLDGASLELRAGEIVGIVGENGSGKSTLLKLLVGALDPDGGTVEASGRVGWCPQEPLLYDRLTVAETMRLFGRAYGMDDADIEDALDRVAEQLGFDRFRDYRIDRLSGGNRQKVNLAVSLLADPDVLLLDEPYTGFDWETYLAFWDLADDLRERGTAVAVISHFVSERDRFDRIYELADGTLSEGETPGDGEGETVRDDPTAGVNADA